MDIVTSLKAWRKSNGLSQEKLAAKLGVSQAAVSRWEAGVDSPSLEVIGRIKTLLDPFTARAIALEELFVREQKSLHVLFDLDGARLLATSKGYARLFPRFSRLVGEQFMDKLIGETKVIFQESSLFASIKLGEIALMSGVTKRHIDHPYDSALNHHWTICFRKIGTQVIGDVAFELCDESAVPKLDKVVRMDEI